MRKLFFRKQARIEQGFEKFLGCIQRSIEVFATGLLSYLEHGESESFERCTELVHRAESEADDVRVGIERTLYQDELLPDSRGDLLSLLEWCDRVANRIEAVIANICMRKIDFPLEINDDIREMLVPVQTAVETLLAGVRLLFVDPVKAKGAADDIDRLESECDRIEHETIRKVYRMDMELAQKIQLERTLADIGSIADRAEDAGHRLEIVAIKRTL